MPLDTTRGADVCSVPSFQMQMLRIWALDARNTFALVALPLAAPKLSSAVSTARGHTSASLGLTKAWPSS
eukprot:2170806-Karenia_brevis.AAC.1